MNAIKRRSFLKTSASAAAVSALPSIPINAQEATAPAATVIVVHGTDIPKMLAAGIAKLGGWDAFIKPGMKVVIKPNVAWNSKPEQGGNTHPDLVKACVLAAEARVPPRSPCRKTRAIRKKQPSKRVASPTR